MTAGPDQDRAIEQYREVLVSEATRESAPDLDAIELQRRGPQWLKNVADPIVVYRAAAGKPITTRS